MRKKPPGSAFGANVRRWRERRKLTQEELAELVGVTRSQITNIENGRMNTSMERLSKMRSVLRVTWAQLLHGV